MTIAATKTSDVLSFLEGIQTLMFRLALEQLDTHGGTVEYAPRGLVFDAEEGLGVVYTQKSVDGQRPVTSIPTKIFVKSPRECAELFGKNL